MAKRLPPPDAHWRDSARIPKFFGIDAVSAFPLLLFLMHIRVWTFVVALSVAIFFTVLRYYGFTIRVFFRWLRGAIGGKRKVAKPWWVW